MKICPICKKTFEGNINICPTDNEILEEDLTTLLGKTLDGQYYIEKLLGQGGMGAVFRAKHTLLGDQVAIKIMPSNISKSADYQRRFLREGKTARQFSHPNVIAVHDLRTTNDGMLYMVLEYVDGHTLHDELKQRRKFFPKEAVEILEPIGEALTLAHSLNIVHRDLKPDNIMVGKAKDGSTIVKLLDLGIAKVQNVDSTALTMTGQILGTPHYMSPEQWNGDEIDGRADIYSLGIILYELVAGTRPFQGKTIQNLAYHHSVTMPPLLCEVVSNVSPEFSKVVQRAIEKDRTNRPANCRELFNELKEALKSEAAIEDTSQASTLVINEPINTSKFARNNEKTSENQGTLITKTETGSSDVTLKIEKKDEKQATFIGSTDTTNPTNKNISIKQHENIAEANTADIDITLKKSKAKPTQGIHAKTLVEVPNKNSTTIEEHTNNDSKSEKNLENQPTTTTVKDNPKPFVEKEKSSKKESTKSFFSEQSQDKNNKTDSNNTTRSSMLIVFGVTGLLVFSLIGVFIWKSKEPSNITSNPTPTATNSSVTSVTETEEVLSYWLEFFPPASKAEQNIVSINEADLKTVPSNYGFRFHFSGKRPGYLYVLGLGENDILTSFLTNNPSAELGLNSNKIQTGDNLSLPNGVNEKGIEKAFLFEKPGKEAYTVIFSTNPLITLSFLNSKPGTFLGKTAIGELEKFRAFAQTAKVNFQPGNDQVKSIGKVLVPKIDDQKPIIFNISFEHN